MLSRCETHAGSHIQPSSFLSGISCRSDAPEFAARFGWLVGYQSSNLVMPFEWVCAVAQKNNAKHNSLWQPRAQGLSFHISGLALRCSAKMRCLCRPCSLAQDALANVRIYDTSSTDVSRHICFPTVRLGQMQPMSFRRASPHSTHAGRPRRPPNKAVSCDDMLAALADGATNRLDVSACLMPGTFFIEGQADEQRLVPSPILLHMRR